ncbi:MAG TPA: protein kinase, partial [Gemmatimonadales bacterium]|nr:protein kinase [Gemmatimonadales bacterium]
MKTKDDAVDSRLTTHDLLTIDHQLSTSLADRYRIERELGHGGMATVYLAYDLRHDRKVAIKVLRPELAALIGADRFLAEIKTTANLQHPHILPLHDSGEAGPALFYVMPYVEGESLRDRLNREKQLPIPDAVRIATEIASALDYAHRRGVIHRDIKPENILLHDGTALVADFGIALAASKASGSRMTETGMSLGTPHYMSPEQAMGERDVNARSDVYALGAVTYEMLTGDPPFTGSTAQAIVARVLTENPRPLLAQRHTIPADVEAAVLTALEKLPADRFASAAEFAAALRGEGTKEHRTLRSTAKAPQPIRQSSRLVQAALLTAGLIAALTAGYLLGNRRTPARPLRASLPTPPGCALADVGSRNLIQLSPDGGMLAFIASCGEDDGIWIRNLVTGEVRLLNGTSDASYPFWAPDGRSLGFFVGNKVKRVDLGSGAVRDLASIVTGRGGSWSTSNIILYAPDITGPIYQIPAEGGTPQPATAISNDSAGITHRLPYFLPDGRTFLFTQGFLNGKEGTVRVGKLGSTENRILTNFPTVVAYAAGRLLYVKDGLLMAQRFDPGKAKLSGSGVSLISGLETWPFRYLGNFSISSGDLLVYEPAPINRTRVVWFDPRSESVASVLEPGPYRLVRVSPKGGRILVERGERDSPQFDVWMYEPVGRAWTRVTSHPDLYYDFAWSPDGEQIGYGAANDSAAHIISLDRTVSRDLDVKGKNVQAMLDWSPDGSFLVGQRQVATTGFDLMIIPLTGNTEPRLLYSTPGNDNAPRLSPDGKLLAYFSNQSGTDEVYVTRMPDAKAHWQVSSGGVSLLGGFRGALAWGRTGKELYFLDGAGQLLSA